MRRNGREDASRRHRVLAFSDFVREANAAIEFTADKGISKYGAAIPPIPVPLFADECASEYEREFQSWFAKRTAKQPMVSERALRFTFASARAEWYGQGSTYKQLFIGRGPETVSLDELPRGALYVEKVVDYGLYRQQVKFGFFRRLVSMTQTQIFNRFGSIVAPIFVPLKTKETVEDYERRFRRWLEAAKHTTVERLEDHPSRMRERDYRIEFASICGTGVEKSARIPKRPPTPTKRSSVEPARKKLSISSEHSEEQRLQDRTTAREESSQSPVPATVVDDGEETEDGEILEEEVEIKLEETASPMTITAKTCPGLTTIEECVACGCHQCFESGHSLLREKEEDVENAWLCFSEHPLATGLSARQDRSSSTASSAVRYLVLSRPTTADLHSAISHRLTTSARECIEPINDPVQTKLEREYEALNEQIVMNEKVLDAATTRLALMPVVNAQETSRLHAENEEMRQLIQSEIPERDAALSMLIVYLWRHNVQELEAMTSDPTATNVLHVRRTSHHKCALISSEIVKMQQLAANLKSQLDATTESGSWDDAETVTKLESLGSRLTKTEAEIIRLLMRRRQEFVMLVHFDERVRLLVQELLARAQKSPECIDGDG